MKFKRSKKSDRGKLQAKLDSMLSQIIKLERGNMCQIHCGACDSVGAMHILSKAAYPRLRYYKHNIVLAGWFCSHYYTHHNPDDKRAKFAEQRIEELFGADYKDKLKQVNLIAPRHTMSYLQGLEVEFKAELDRLKGVR